MAPELDQLFGEACDSPMSTWDNRLVILYRHYMRERHTSFLRRITVQRRGRVGKTQRSPPYSWLPLSAGLPDLLGPLALMVPQFSPKRNQPYEVRRHHLGCFFWRSWSTTFEKLKSCVVFLFVWLLAFLARQKVPRNTSNLTIQETTPCDLLPVHNAIQKTGHVQLQHYRDEVRVREPDKI